MAVDRLEITSRRPYADGRSFGETGPYEFIEGRLHCSVDPDDSHNRAIVDLDKAPCNSAGTVSFSADFSLLKPVAELAKLRLIHDVVNRGNRTAIRLNLAAATPGELEPPAGDGFLMRHGYAVSWCGWQPDVPDRPGMMRSYLPEALEDGERIKGQAFLQFQPAKLTQMQLLSDAGHRPMPAADLAEPGAVLTVREYHDGPARVIPRQDWQFAKVGAIGEAVADPNFVCYAAGFQPGMVYELTYTTVGAPVMGLGLLATRDCVSWLRNGSAEAGNPLGGQVANAYGFGVSLTARHLREFLYTGLNEDEEGRQVFDGALTVVGSSRRGEFNFRFAQPSTNIARAPGNQFPFTYAPEVDPLTGQRGSLLERCREQGKAPKLIAVNSGMEYWWSGASLQHIDVTASRDLTVPDDVRLYYFCGTQHASGGLPLNDTMVDGFRTANLLNAVDYNPMLRAKLTNLDRWVREGAEPPASRVPSLSDATAVQREALESTFRALPGAGFPNHLPRKVRLDFGPDAGNGILTYPPTEGDAYTVLVSTLDDDGNEVAGVRAVDLRVPLATYMGWNLRHPEVGQPGEYVSGPLPGSTIPLARTISDRSTTGDPRPSIEERYRDKDDFLVQTQQAAVEMVQEGHLLEEDLGLISRQASARWDALTNRSSA